MFKIIHDRYKPIVFVGNTGLNQQLHENLARPSRVCSFEQVQSMDNSWFERHQFMCVTGDYDLKRKIVDFLESKHVAFFSIVGEQNLIDPNVTIGVNTFINSYNDLLGSPIHIGHHVILSCYCQLGRDVKISDFCHVSSYVYVNNCHVGEGTALGTRSSVLGPKITDEDTKHIAPMCNFLANSVITKNITETGTYFGNRKSNSLSRQQYRII